MKGGLILFSYYATVLLSVKLSNWANQTSSWLVSFFVFSPSPADGRVNTQPCGHLELGKVNPPQQESQQGGEKKKKSKWK